MLVTLFKGLLIVLLAIPLSILALLSVPVDKSGKSFHLIARTWSRFILWIFGIKVKVRGLEHLEPKRHYVYVSNHASMFDIPALIIGIPDDVRLVLKKELTKVPIWGWALRYGHYITIDRGKARAAMKSLERAAERMRTGASVILFAEGTRTRDGKLQDFKRGAFSLAVRSGVPIVPVAINNTFGILPKGSIHVRPADIEMVLEKPIPTSNVEGREAETRLLTEVRAAIKKHYVEQS
ncbi:MAG: 1-acyl-sn-glycerol-3-phosphate acyltransferase [Ignavibacteria bacterium]|nr:1-acyl-sn-glycerol-3-phosphate acyltransferase [Ignavibacteria bacterium]